MHKELYILQQDALVRAKKRLALVRRRVSDGINLKADLLRAESAKIFQEEQLDQARQDFNQSMYSLSSLLTEIFQLMKLVTLRALSLSQRFY